MHRIPLRVAVFTQLTIGAADPMSRSFGRLHRVVTDWAERHRHRIVLVVAPKAAISNGSSPGTSHFPGVPLAVSYKNDPTVAQIVATNTPDLVLSVGYPWLIEEAVTAIPPLGSLNLHPSALPAGRGGNPARLIYEGGTTMGATLHRLAPSYDSGPILSRIEQPLPPNLSGPTLLEGWARLFDHVLEEGAGNLLDNKGVEQDETRASYCQPFTRDDYLLDPAIPTADLLRKVAALNVFITMARLKIGGHVVRVDGLRDATPVTVDVERGKPGAVLARHRDGWTVWTADGAVRVTGDREPSPSSR